MYFMHVYVTRTACVIERVNRCKYLFCDFTQTLFTCIWYNNLIFFPLFGKSVCVCMYVYAYEQSLFLVTSYDCMILILKSIVTFSF